MASSGRANQPRIPRIDDDTEGVVSASYPRKVQSRGPKFEVTLVKEWARLLGLNNQGAPIEQRLITGDEPVAIEEPAIVIRPHNGGVGNE